MKVGVGMDTIKPKQFSKRVCALSVLMSIPWQLYIFDLMRRFQSLNNSGFPDTTGSFELLGSAKYFVLLFSIACAFLGYSMWRWKNNRILIAVLLTILVLCITYAINVWVIFTAYTPVLEQGS